MRRSDETNSERVAQNRQVLASGLVTKILSVAVALMIGALIYAVAWRVTRPAPVPLPSALIGAWQVISARSEQGIELDDIRYRVQYRTDGTFLVACPEESGRSFDGFVIPPDGIVGHWAATGATPRFRVKHFSMRPAGEDPPHQADEQTEASAVNVTIRPGGTEMERLAEGYLTVLRKVGHE